MFSPTLAVIPVRLVVLRMMSRKDGEDLMGSIQCINFKRQGLAVGCFRLAADAPPLEGLLILRYAIYDPLEGSQIWKMKAAKMRVQDLIFAFVNMLHMLSYVHQGLEGGGGVLTFLTSTWLTLRNTTPWLTCCTCRRIFIRGVGGVFTFLTSCNKDYPHKRFKIAQINHVFVTI